MLSNQDPANLGPAIQDFRRARSQADLKELLGRLSGESKQLLSYDQVRQKLGLQGGLQRGLRDIPLGSIIGSVGRYTDFTRDFLPRRDINPERWARVKIAASGLVGLPPIEVYQIGEVYFVSDGNHRVSVARNMGATHIQAYVTEVSSRVPLTPDMQLDDLILIAEYNDFLEKTRLHELRPDANLRVTIPGQYPLLLEHISGHQYFMGLDFKRDISYPEAVAHWYDAVYLPVIHIIREQAVMHRFRERTETDLYLWLAQHQAQIEEQLGWKIQTEYAANDLVEHYSSEKSGSLNWLGSQLLDLITPDQLDSGPPAGQWRSLAASSRPCDCLFLDLLVPINGKEDGWCALEQALVVAQKENATLHGLYIVKSDAKKTSPAAQKVKSQFDQRCSDLGIEGKLIIAVSDQVAKEITQRAGYTDLVVTNLTYPPSSRPLARLVSGFRDLIVHCPRPILATPRKVTAMQRGLLAYDGSPKSKEALYVAAYLASKWKISLVVVTVSEDNQEAHQVSLEAQQYLAEHSAQVTSLIESGPVADTILKISAAQDCDFLIMGGYGLNPVLEVVLGSAVDRVLRASQKPMLICR